MEPTVVLFITILPRGAEAAEYEGGAFSLAAALDGALPPGGFALENRVVSAVPDMVEALLSVSPTVAFISRDASGGKEPVIRDKEIEAVLPLVAEHVRCVLFDIGSSHSLAASTSRHIDYVVGMAGPLPPSAMFEFAVIFFTAVNAGRSLEDAFDWGCAGLGAAHEELRELPRLFKRSTSVEEGLVLRPATSGRTRRPK